MSQIEDIAQSIFEEQCIFVCGSGLSAINNRQLNNKEIVSDFIDQYNINQILNEYTEEDIFNKSLQEVAQIYYDSSESGETIQEVANRISTEFLEKKIDLHRLPSTTHLLLANLGIRDIYTTNYDNLLEYAYEMVGFREKNIIDIFNFEKINFNGLPNIYKLCGTAGSHGVSVMHRQFSDDMCISNLHYPFMRQTMGKAIVFIGYNRRDQIILRPYINFIQSCSPRKCYCLVANNSEIEELNQSELFRGLPGFKYIVQGISEFIAHLQIKYLSKTFKYFKYLSDKRKVIESHGLELLKNQLESNTARRITKINKISAALTDHRYHLANASKINTWYYDYKFHQSLYSCLENDGVYKKDFSEIYLKLKNFYSTYQSKHSIEDHNKIFTNLRNEKYTEAIESLEAHIENATNDALFWYSYIVDFCESDFLSNILKDYGEPLRFCRKDSDENEEFNEEFLDQNHRVLLVGPSGSGKTSFVGRLMMLSLATFKAIPIYIDCNNLSFEVISLFKDCENFVEFFSEFLALKPWNLNSEKIISQRVDSGKIVLVVDGIDKLNGNLNVVASAITRYQGQVDNHMKILVSSNDDHIKGKDLATSMNLETMYLDTSFFDQSESIPTIAMATIKIFISYSHKDDDLRAELVTHLSNLRRQGKIAAWHDRAIEAGEEWETQIKSNLESAQIILLLISPPFMASNYCYDIEMERAIARHNEGTARMIPIILRPCDWKDSPFSKLQILPKDALPVTKWSDRDSAFLDVVQGIRRAVESLSKK